MRLTLSKTRNIYLTTDLIAWNYMTGGRLLLSKRLVDEEALPG